MIPPRPTLRIDKWLWHARFFKTRSLSGKLVSGGHVRLNEVRIAKPSVQVGAGDVLTFPQAKRIRVVEILDVSTHRGPAVEAEALYNDLTPPAPPKPNAPISPGYNSGGRPTKRDRRALARFKRH